MSTETGSLHKSLQVFPDAAMGRMDPDDYFASTCDASKAAASPRKKRSDLGLRLLEAAADEALVDVSWIDRCPTLDCLRGDSRFAKIRKEVLRRAEAIWLV